MNECKKSVITSNYVLIDETELINMSIEERSTLTEAIEIIDETFSALNSRLNFKTIMTNEGEGIPIYSGYTENRGHSFKTLKSDGAIVIKEEKEEIIITVAKELLEGEKYTFENTGKGIGVYKGKRKEGDSEIVSLKSIISSDLTIEDADDSIIINFTKDFGDSMQYLKDFVPSNYKKAFNDKYEK